MKYFLLPFGCQMNLSDTERIATVLDAMGLERTENEDEAELRGIVACSVRQRAIDRVYGRIHKWNREKDRRNLITFISGCVLDEDEKKFLKLFDFLFRMPDLPRLPEIIRNYGISTPASFSLNIPENEEDTTSFWQIPPTSRSPFSAWVPIQNGCNKFCSYCAVPYTRGREVSRKSAEILREVRDFIEKGYKSITLLGQNVNSYGLDKKGSEIPFKTLLERIAQQIEAAGGDVWVYFTSPHPSDMDPEVFDVIAAHACLARQIHLPLQSGSDAVLARMKRSYTLADFRKLVSKMRESIPEVSLFTDMISGFPGESEAEFEESLAAFDEFAFNMAYIAVYSARPGTAAARLPDDVPHKVKKERLHQLTEVFKKSALAANEKLLGQTIPVLVTGRDKKEGWLSGHSEGLLPLRFPANGVAADALIGTFSRVTITSVTELSAEGEMPKK